MPFVPLSPDLVRRIAQNEKYHDRVITTERLILRGLRPSEVGIWRRVRSYPENDKFGALLEPKRPTEQLATSMEQAVMMDQIQFFVILKNYPYSHDCNLEDGLLISCIELCEPRYGSTIGGVTHHQVAGKGFGTLVFAAVIDYALNDPQRTSVHLEAKTGNLGCRAMMNKISLVVETPGTIHAEERDEPEECVTWTFNKAMWDRVKERVAARHGRFS